MGRTWSASQARLTTGRPPGMAGMDMLVPMAFNVPVSVPSPGQLVLRAAVDDRPPRRHEVARHPAPTTPCLNQGPR